MLADRRDELSKTRVQAANRLHRLLSELVPGQGKKDITTGQAKTILASVRPRDVAGKVRRRLAAEQVADLVAVEKKIKALTKELKAMVLGLRLDPDGVARRRTGRGRPHPGRYRRRRPVHRPQPVRVVDRHRPHRSLLRGDRATPALPGREPADEPHDPHRRGHPDPP